MNKQRLGKIILGLIGIPGLIAFSFWQLEQKGFFNLDKIDVIVEETPESPQYLQAWIKDLDQKLERFRGVSLWKIDLMVIADLLKAEPWIENSNLSRRFPSQVRIYLRPKQVESILMSKSGQLYPVVADGSLLQTIDSRLAPDVPLLVGDLLEKNLELRKKSIHALKEIPAQGAFSRKTISEIRYDSKEGFWMTMIKSGIKVKMGDEQMKMKSERVSQVIDYMAAHNFEARVIDANLSKKVLVRLRKDP